MCLSRSLFVRCRLLLCWTFWSLSTNLHSLLPVLFIKIFISPMHPLINLITWLVSMTTTIYSPRIFLISMVTFRLSGSEILAPRWLNMEMLLVALSDMFTTTAPVRLMFSTESEVNMYFCISSLSNWFPRGRGASSGTRSRGARGAWTGIGVPL